MLLGLKETMSETELHFIHEQMLGDASNKAGCGELKSSLPAYQDMMRYYEQAAFAISTIV